MLNVLSRLLPRREAKASRVPQALALYVTGHPVWTPRDYAALAREGFQRNPVVHRAVRLVAEAAASLPLSLVEGGRLVAEHPLAALLAKPNPREGGARFLEGVYGHLLVSGNAYVEAVSVEDAPRELYALRPDRMRVVPGRDGWPAAYDYAVGAETVRFVQEGDIAPILHLTLFHPTDDHYGLSPMEAAAVPLDIHNAAGAWNKALLDNAARPSGALVFGSAGAALTEPQFERLKAELEANYQGAANAGRPLLLEGGLDWKPLSLSPKDMDFIEAKNAAAREIALAFGVPPLLLGLPGDNTHANYAEANRAFYRQTVIPLVKRTAQAVAQWLAPAYGDPGSGPGEAILLEPDLDAIEALSDERESLWRRVSAADFLTADEKREAIGYGRRLERAFGRKYRPDQPRVPRGNPEGGQFTNGGGSGSGRIRLAQGDRLQGYAIDLREEDAKGGHTITGHVAKSESYVLNEVRDIQASAQRKRDTSEGIEVGSFTSLESATRLVNSTLARNPEPVAEVTSGAAQWKTIYQRFDSPTGFEAFAATERSQPYIRETYGVGVHIRPDQQSDRGFRVHSAFPSNRER